MFPNLRLLVLALVAGSAVVVAARGADKAPAGCAATVDNYFLDEVWAKVGVGKCLACHRKGGDAEDSKFLLHDPRKGNADAALRHNRDAFARMARATEKDRSRMLLKVVGQPDHGGKDVLKPDSAGYRILADFVRRVTE